MNPADFLSKAATLGATCGATSKDGSRTSDKTANSKELRHNEVWLSVQDVVAASGLSKRSVQRNAKSGKYETRQISGNGGLQYEISLSSLPPDAQALWYEANLPDEMADEEVPEEQNRDLDALIYSRAPEYNRRKADKYLQALEFCDGLRGQALKDRIEEWNTLHPDMQTSYARILDARKTKKQQGIEGLLGSYGQTRGRAFAIEDLGELGQAAYRRFKGTYLNEDKKSREDCHRAALGMALRIQEEIDPSGKDELHDRFPHIETFLRTLKKEMSESAIYLRRYGKSAWERKYGVHLDRDDSNVAAGEIWESDHHQIDNLWIAKAEGLTAEDAAHIRAAVAEMKTKLDGRHLRPWLTAWRDYKTGKMLSWRISFDAPNAERVLNTFADAVEKYGVPAEVRIDNGKDYRAYDVAGGRRKIEIDERATRSIMSVLGVKATFVWTYHGQSKRIERSFKQFAHQLAKLCEGYVGHNTVNRPEKLQAAVKKNALLSFAEGCRAVDSFVETIYHRIPSQGKNLKGRSIAQAWEDEFDGLPKLDSDSLALLRMRSTKPLAIRGGVQHKGRTYYAPWMETYKGSIKVYLRLPSDPSENIAWVFRADTDELLGRAYGDALTAPGTVRTDEDQALLSDRIKLKTQIHKSVDVASRPEDNPDLAEVRADIATAIQQGNAIVRGVIVHLSDPAAIGRVLLQEYVDTATGECFEPGTELTEMVIDALIAAGYSQVRVERLESNIHVATRYDRAIEKEEELKRDGTFGVLREPAREKPADLIRFPSQLKK